MKILGFLLGFCSVFAVCNTTQAQIHPLEKEAVEIIRQIYYLSDPPIAQAPDPSYQAQVDQYYEAFDKLLQEYELSDSRFPIEVESLMGRVIGWHLIRGTIHRIYPASFFSWPSEDLELRRFIIRNNGFHREVWINKPSVVSIRAHELVKKHPFLLENVHILYAVEYNLKRSPFHVFSVPKHYNRPPVAGRISDDRWREQYTRETLVDPLGAAIDAAREKVLESHPDFKFPLKRISETREIEELQRLNEVSYFMRRLISLCRRKHFR